MKEQIYCNKTHVNYRLKEQEELLKKMEEKTEKKGSSGDNVKHNDIEELMEIERIMREQEKEEKKKISQTIFDEDLLQIAQSTSAYSGKLLFIIFQAQ